MSDSCGVCSFYYPRTPATFGHVTALDAIVKDGLTDVYGDYPMGNWYVHSHWHAMKDC